MLIETDYQQIEQAKKTLESYGYFVDNLWRIEDVQDKFECSGDDAQYILYKALTNDATMQQIWLAIDICAESILTH